MRLVGTGHAPGYSLWMVVSANPRGLTELALGLGVCALGGSTANSQQPTTSRSILPGSARRQGQTACEQQGTISDQRSPIVEETIWREDTSSQSS
jgi:hypothetical protein